MMRKYHVRFGGGRLEKGPQGYLVSRLPNAKAVLEGYPCLPAYLLTQEEADLVKVP